MSAVDILLYSTVRQAQFQFSARTAKNQCENSKQIFPEKELSRHSPNFYIHVSVSDLYNPTINLPTLLQERGPIPGNIKIAQRHMNVEIGTEAAQFPKGINKWDFSYILRPRTLQMATNDRCMTVFLKNVRNKILENKQIYLADSVGCQSQNTFVLVLVSVSLYLCIFTSECLSLAVYAWIIYLVVYF
jgi:hypothetical protein